MIGGFDVGTLIQSIATVVALLGVIASVAIARRGQKQDLRLATQEAVRAERAERAGAASARRAENAAALTIDSLTRMADALEDLASKGGRPTLAPASARRRVAWRLENARGNDYALRNTGDADAFDVQVSAAASLWQGGALPAAAVVHPGGVLAFAAARTADTTDSTITVEWSRTPDSEDRDTWRYPLPPAGGSKPSAG